MFINESSELIVEFCRKCGCNIERGTLGVAIQNNTTKDIEHFSVWDDGILMNQALKFKQENELNEVIKNEKDFRKKRKLVSKQYNTLLPRS